MSERGPHDSCGAAPCPQVANCEREGECHYTKSPFWEPRDLKSTRISQTMNVNRFMVEDKDGTVRVHAYVSDYVAGEAQQRLEYGYGVVCWVEKDI